MWLMLMSQLQQLVSCAANEILGVSSKFFFIFFVFVYYSILVISFRRETLDFYYNMKVYCVEKISDLVTAYT